MSKELTIFGEIDTSVTKKIERIEDRSGSAMTRARIFFKNGHELSVVRGDHSYGGKEGLFEIMPTCPEVFDQDPDDEWRDEVKGYLTAEQVNEYIVKVANMGIRDEHNN